MGKPSVVELPLEQIDADYAWNARSGEFWQDGFGEDVYGEGFRDLKGSIATTGLDQPIAVRATGEGEALRFSVVAGFRRYRAVCELNESGRGIPDLQPGYIFAIVSRMTEVEARAHNLRENAQRERVPVSDLAWGAYELHKLGASPEEVALEINKSLGHTRNLIQIMERLPPKMTAAWRAGRNLKGGGTAVRLPVEDMLTLLRTPAEQREERYEEFYRSGGNRPRRESSKGYEARGRLEAIRARDLGVTLAELEAAGLILVPDAQRPELWKTLVKRPRSGWTPEEWAKAAAAAFEGFLSPKTEPVPGVTGTARKRRRERTSDGRRERRTKVQGHGRA